MKRKLFLNEAGRGANAAILDNDDLIAHATCHGGKHQLDACTIRELTQGKDKTPLVVTGSREVFVFLIVPKIAAIYLP